jgi:formate dehydrogenase major subunit
LRGQNNVQGASDAGLIPMMLPDYQHVSKPEVRERFEKAWKLPAGTLDDQVGLTVVEVMHAIKHGQIKGMYVQGENPAMSDPDANHAREALAALDHLVVQDIFLTETAYLADVILPAGAFPEKTGSFTNTDRMVQMGRQAINPPGDARQDLWIIQQIGKRLGLPWDYRHVSEVFDEMRHTMPSIAGITWERLEREHSVTYPCANEGDPGEPVVFTEDFPREGGKARFVPADIIPAAERPDAEYPMVLITGRQLEHWHTGSMTRRASVLDAIEPDPTALLHPLDLAALGAQPGDLLTLESRRGQVTLWARADAGTPRGAVFVAFAYYEAAINKLTHAALDPFAKIPEFKYCAVRVKLGGDAPLQSSYGGGQILSTAPP